MSRGRSPTAARWRPRAGSASRPTARRLAGLAGDPGIARLVAALVRCELAGDHDEVRAAAE
jgi:hypothetical protein